jgi:O-antigen ligase
MLGAICLIGGLFFFWDTLRRWPMRKARQSKRVLAVNIAFIAMTLWLMNLSNSATSKLCLIIGCLVIAIARSRWAAANPRGVTIGIPVVLTAAVVLDFAFDVSSLVAELLGREPTLTGRTGMWSALLSIRTNFLVGVGYQSFWLGDRLETVFKILKVSFLNEAHNGYLEIYLSLGVIGLTLVSLFMASTYRRLARQLLTSPGLASLGFAVWTVMVFYNLTEAAFGASLLWFTLLLCGIVVPRPGGKMPAEPQERDWRTVPHQQRYAALADVRKQ